MSQRGNPLFRRVDAMLGPALITALGALIKVRKLFLRKRDPDGAVLIVCIGAIGDLLLVSAVADKVLTGRRLVLACTPENIVAASIFPGLYADVLPLRLSRPWSLLQSLRGQRISAIMDSTQWANASAVQVGLLKVARPSVKLSGFATATRAREMVYDHLVTHSESAHEVANFAALLGDADFDPASIVNERPASSNQVALHLWPSGTRSHLKEWPQDHWVALARQLHAEGYELSATGSPSDSDRNNEFISAAQVPITNLAGSTSLREVYEFLHEHVRLCVSVNTGTMHLAALAGTAVIALNGPTNPNRWGPVGPNSLSLTPPSGNFAYLNYGFEYPESDEEAYALDRLPATTVLAAALDVLRSPERVGEIRINDAVDRQEP